MLGLAPGAAVIQTQGALDTHEEVFTVPPIFLPSRANAIFITIKTPKALAWYNQLHLGPIHPSATEHFVALAKASSCNMLLYGLELILQQEL